MRLELLISSVNVASKRVAERTGYTYEGTLRALFVKPGVWRTRRCGPASPATGDVPVAPLLNAPIAPDASDG
jgi:hypothetical protein